MYVTNGQTDRKSVRQSPAYLARRKYVIAKPMHDWSEKCIKRDAQYRS